MKTLKIFAYTCALLLSSTAAPLAAQPVTTSTPPAPPVAQPAATATADSAVTPKPRVRGVQYASREEAAAAMRADKGPLFAGVSVSADVCGMAMAAFAPYGQLEAACRVNLRNRYFPIFEMGWGRSDHRSDATDIRFKTGAPYFRIGCDYNIAKDKHSGNRIFAGLRYAFSSYAFDLDGPAVADPVWGGSTPYVFSGLSGRAQWGEIVVGLEARICKFFHLGWSARYRLRFHEKVSPVGRAWYIPGYGKNGGHVFGGTFNIVFDI